MKGTRVLVLLPLLVGLAHCFWGLRQGRANRVEDIYLRCYNGQTADDYVDIPLSQASRLLQLNGFDTNNPTVFYIHGYIEVPQQESIRVVVSSYLQARPGTNFILLDWSNMAKGSYLLNAAPNSIKVGTAAADQLNILFQSGLLLEKFHMIGFSLGCHVAGYAARDLKTRYNKVVKRLTVLDPAFPGFYPGLVLRHVNANDAEFVDVIHADAGGYGAPVPTGTADFWPNGGKGVQPGCPLFAPIPLSNDNLCSHWRAWRYFAESVINPEAFPASPAVSYLNFRANPTPAVGMVYMGYGCDKNARGSYYLTTNAITPYGRGMYGLQ